MNKKILKQFHDLKAKHPDALLLFRCGDFYETYLDDAVTASKILDLILMQCDKGKEIVAFPHMVLDIYLPRLIRAGQRVAIFDQIDG